METTIDKIRPLQILYNLQKCGINIDNILNSSNPIYEEWAEKVLDENKELFKEQSKEEFINYVVYGK